MSLEAGVAGSLGISASYAGTRQPYTTPTQDCWSYALTVTPALSLDAFGRLNALDVKVLKAGVKVSLTLMNLGLPVSWHLGARTTASAVEPGNLDKADVHLSSGADAALRVETLSGRISVFLAVSVEWLGVDVTYSYSLFKWPGIALTLPLWDSSYEVSLSDLAYLMENP